eukprot:768498-Hanusia_phi.AAC.3
MRGTGVVKQYGIRSSWGSGDGRRGKERRREEGRGEEKRGGSGRGEERRVGERRREEGRGEEKKGGGGEERRGEEGRGKERRVGERRREEGRGEEKRGGEEGRGEEKRGGSGRGEERRGWLRKGACERRMYEGKNKMFDASKMQEAGEDEKTKGREQRCCWSMVGTPGERKSYADHGDCLGPAQRPVMTEILLGLTWHQMH